MIKFSGVENEDADSERETNFVRQKTPHPRELKAKAHKLFGSSPHRSGVDGLDGSHQTMNGTTEGKEGTADGELEDEGIHQEDEEDEIAYKGKCFFFFLLFFIHSFMVDRLHSVSVTFRSDNNIVQVVLT